MYSRTLTCSVVKLSLFDLLAKHFQEGRILGVTGSHSWAFTCRNGQVTGISQRSAKKTDAGSNLRQRAMASSGDPMDNLIWCSEVRIMMSLFRLLF